MKCGFNTSIVIDRGNYHSRPMGLLWLPMLCFARSAAILCLGRSGYEADVVQSTIKASEEGTRNSRTTLIESINPERF